MIASGLKGVEFVACNTDSQSLKFCNAKQKIQLGIQNTQGLGAGSDPSIGKSAAEESYNEICEYIDGAHMAFIAAGMGAKVTLMDNSITLLQDWINLFIGNFSATVFVA